MKYIVKGVIITKIKYALIKKGEKMKKAKLSRREKKRRKKTSYKGFKTFVNGKEVKETEEEPTFVTPTLNEVKIEDISYVRPKTDDIEVSAEEIEVVLPLHIHLKMMAYVKMVDSEINGLGLVEKVGSASFRITEIYLLDQKVSGASCDIDNLAFTKLMEKLIAEGKNPSMIRFWWHSHNTMGTGWSTTDEKTGKKFAGSEYLISLVAAHNGDMRARINIYQPVEIEVDNIKIIIENPIPDNNIIEECKKEIQDCVKEEKKDYSGYNYDYQSEFPYGESVVEKRKGSEIENSGPWGDNFLDGDVRLVWNKEKRKYEGYDVNTNLLLTEEEFIDRTEINYNAYLDQDDYPKYQK